MALFDCGCKKRCAVLSVIVSAVVGVLVAFLRFAAVIAINPVAYIVAFGIGVLFLAIAYATAALNPGNGADGACPTLTALLVGALGTVATSLVLLGVGFTATSTVGALVNGVLGYFFAQTLTAAACRVRELS